MEFVQALVVRRPITGLCTFLAGEGVDTHVTLTVLLVDIQMHGYSGKCGMSHLGGGRCAFCDTHLARIHVHMHTCRIEGEHMCDMIFSLMFVRSARHSRCSCACRLLSTSGRTYTQSVSQAYVRVHEQSSDVRSKAYRHASAVSGSSRF